MGRNGKIFALPEHIDRIFNGMAKLKINPPCSKQEMADTLLEMLARWTNPRCSCTGRSRAERRGARMRSART